jgi:hypothetical protein
LLGVVSRGAPPAPGVLRIRGRAYLRVEREDAPLPVQQVELVHFFVPGRQNKPSTERIGGSVVMSSSSLKLVGVAATSAVVAGVLALPGALALERPGTIRITDAERRHSHIDFGAAGPSAGDVDAYRSVLYNRRIQARPLGHADMVCTTITRSTQSCNATYFLPRGQLVVSGVISSRLIYILAVVGGTEYYNNAHGTLTVTSVHRSPTRELLLFRLVV